jgi:glutathione S-transferase
LSYYVFSFHHVQVPVIQDGDFVLAESAVIAHYIVNKYGGPLADVTPEEEARIQIFQEQYGGYVISPYYGLLRAQDAETQAKQRDELLSVLRYISKQYSQTKGPYFLGDKFSFADLLWWPWIHRLSVLAHYRNFVVPQEPEYAAYHQYVAAMSARPSIQATSMPAQFFIDGYKSYANPQE